MVYSRNIEVVIIIILFIIIINSYEHQRVLTAQRVTVGKKKKVKKT